VDFSADHTCNAIGAYGGRLQSENLTPNIDSFPGRSPNQKQRRPRFYSRLNN
jgi:hypothetical protein